MKRFWIGVQVVAALLCVGAAGYAGYRAFTPGEAPQIAIGGPFSLVDGSGRAVTDQNFRGRWMLVYFGYTHCPDACPTTLNTLAEAMDALGPVKQKAIVPVFISVDPDRDTPAIMQDYVKSFGPEFVGLTGSQQQVGGAEHAYRVYAAKHPTSNGDYDMDHSSIVYVMNPEGQFVTSLSADAKPDAIAQQLETLMAS
jgi:cytochrome oxidase Cu insertion factor (SCO1/SenC/PrrC family)